MNTYTWIIEQMQSVPQDGSMTDVVINVAWRCNGTDGTYNATVYSTCAVPAPTGSFTPYADLTQDQVLGWIWANGVDQAATEANLDTQIANMVNPPVVSLPLPW